MVTLVTVLKGIPDTSAKFTVRRVRTWNESGYERELKPPYRRKSNYFSGLR